MSKAADFLALLKAVRDDRDRELREHRQRTLGFGDAMFDRWEKARRLGFGDAASIYDSAIVMGDVEVGEHTWVGPNVMLDGSGAPLRIGDWCSISAGVQLYTHDTIAWALTAGEASKAVGAITIGDRCHIGAGTIIRPGVTIGPGSVVGAGSFVREHVLPGQVVGGVPARVLGRVNVHGDQVEFDYGPVTGPGDDRPQEMS